MVALPLHLLTATLRWAAIWAIFYYLYLRYRAQHRSAIRK